MFDKARYLAEHERVWDEYRAKYANRCSCLIEDGVVDVENFGGVLFLLKEAYDKAGNTEWNLAERLAKSSPWGMWHRVGQWACGILNTTEGEIAPFHTLSAEEAREYLHRIAVVNVKKVDGKERSEDADIARHARENAELIRAEIESVQPQIIVCGNTFQYLNQVYGNPVDKKRHHCENWYYRTSLGRLDDVLVIDYYHPAAQYPSLPLYYGLAGIYQQALLNKT